MAESVGGLSFDMEVDTSGIKTSINKCASEVNARMTSAFNNTGKNVEASLQKVQNAIERTTSKLERQKINLQAQQNSVNQLNDKLSQLNSKYEQQTSAIQKQEGEVERLSKEYEELASAIGALGVPTASQMKELERLGKQLESAKNKLSSMNDKATATKNSINKTADSLNIANLHLQNTQKETDRTESELNELKQSFDKLSKANQGVENLEKSVKELGDSSKEVDKLNNSIQKLDKVDGVGSKFDKLTSSIKKIGGVLAAAFAVHKIIDFGKEAIELGSDLAEVQNVVDVTFPKMSEQVNKFAQNAASQFGLSETMAKKFTGTFGAMAKAFGFNEKAAYDMSTALTGLAGDVASFYNITQDEAYTKLKSVFTGETESLKDLGVVMTQTALDAYALANGYGKTTQKMSEAEKVALRFAFVQDQLALASGDFARTSDSWANQVQILQLNFDSLKATIGQGLINVFLPVVKVINMVIGKLMVLANAFKSFTELITGKKAEQGSGIQETGAVASSAADEMSGAAGAADDMAKSTKGAGKAAKKAAKDMKALLSFDEIHRIGDNAADTGDGGSDSGSSGSGGSGGITNPSVDMGKLAEGDTVVDKLDERLSKLIERFKQLADLFKQGFILGVGDLSVFDSIQDNIESIGFSLKEIFTDKSVISSANTFLDSLALNLGKVAGSLVSVGATIADNITGGIAGYLEQNTDRIKDFLVSMFDIGTEVSGIIGDLSITIADIFTIFRSDSAKQITTDLIAIFSNAQMGIIELAGKIGRDLLKAISTPIIENKDSIKNALVGTLDGIEPIFTALSDIVTGTFEKINEVYDTYVEPAWARISNGLSTIVSMAVDAFQTYLLPVIQRIGEEFKKLAEEHIQPLIDSFLEFAGKVVEAFSMLWEFLSPFIGWFIESFIAQIASTVESAWDKIKAIISALSDVLNGVFEILSGILDFVTGIFTGDWEKAWTGIKGIFDGVWTAIKGIVSAAITFVKDTIQIKLDAVKNTVKVIWDGIKQIFSSAWEAIKKIFSPVADWFKEKFTSAYNGIQSAFSQIKSWATEKWNSVQESFEDTADWFGSKFKSAYKNVTNAFSETKTWASGKWSDVKESFKDTATWFGSKFKSAYKNTTDAFSQMKSWATGKYKNVTSEFSDVGSYFKGKFESAYKSMTSAFDGTKSFFSELWSTIKSGFTGIGETVGDAVGGALKSVINGVLQTVENTINKGIDLINGALKIARKIPGLGGLGSIGRLNLPRLAQGGFVKKNTPQLALIGDNRHQGEVVAPENKLLEMARQAASMVGNDGSGSPEIIALLKELIDLIKRLDLTIYLDSEVIAKANIIGQKKLERRYKPV